MRETRVVTMPESKEPAEFNRVVLRDQVKEVILGRILDGTYAAGERIVESRLMAEFHVSQAPIRECMRELEAMRLIESEPHRGSRVRSVSLTQLAEMYPVRSVLEGLAGKEAAPLITDEALNRLQDEMDAMQVSSHERDLHAQLHHDVEFHRIIVEAAGNSLLLEVWLSLHLELRTLITFQISADLPGIADSHLPILEALKARDAVAAEEILRDHFVYANDLIMPPGDAK
jgi:DNA-binding GntR family transcriptional regulator